MAARPHLIVYTLEHCPNCELLKSYLDGLGITYTEEDMSSAASLTELRVNGVFVKEAPVLRKNQVFLTSRELFSAGKVRAETIARVLEGV
jgi:glutaredoxin